MGFKLGKVCPYAESADLVVGETTCDGKKKAYELLGELHTVHVMELPQMKRAEDLAFWRAEVERSSARLEEVTGRRADRRDARDRHQGGQRQAPRSAAHRRGPRRSRTHQRQGRPARHAGRLLRRRAALHPDDEHARRRARAAGRRRAWAPRPRAPSASSSPAPRWRCPTGSCTTSSRRLAASWCEEMCTGSRYYAKLVTRERQTDRRR